VLTLSEAQKSGRLEEFIAQQEAAGIEPIDRAEFDILLSKVVKAPQSKGRTSRSASDENSTGKRTRRDNGPDASS
jgi:hypothetical protein